MLWNRIICPSLSLCFYEQTFNELKTRSCACTGSCQLFGCATPSQPSAFPASAPRFVQCQEYEGQRGGFSGSIPAWLHPCPAASLPMPGEAAPSRVGLEPAQPVPSLIPPPGEPREMLAVPNTSPFPAAFILPSQDLDHTFLLLFFPLLVFKGRDL